MWAAIIVYFFLFFTTITLTIAVVGVQLHMKKLKREIDALERKLE